MTRRVAPPIPARSRFAVHDRARIRDTRITFDVVGVSTDGETITGASGVTYHARQCERIARQRRTRAA